MDRTRRGSPASLKQLRAAVERWRTTREKQGPMPPELWSAAVEQAAEHGVAAVARVARLDYGSLSKRLAQSCGETNAAQDGPMRFVELDARPFAQAQEPTGTVVEFCEPDGRRLVIRFCGHEPLNLPALLGSWQRS
jgi:hypothetical protein